MIYKIALTDTERFLLMNNSREDFNNLLCNGISDEEVKKRRRVKSVCSICLEEIKYETLGECGHSYCTVCIMKNLRYNSRCPICREELSSEKIYFNLKNQKIGSKVDKLMEIIEKEEEGVIVILNEREISFIKKKLSEKNIESLIITEKNRMEESRVMLLEKNETKLLINKDIRKIITLEGVDINIGEVTHYILEYEM